MEEDDILSTLQFLRNKIEDLEIRVGQVLIKQLNTKRELDLIKETPGNIDEAFNEGDSKLEFPSDYHFTKDLQDIMENMIQDQKMWKENVEKSMNQTSAVKGLKIVDEMSKHISDRLQYLEMAKTILQGPLLEDPPPPEEPVVEEVPKEEKSGKSKKGKKK